MGIVNFKTGGTTPPSFTPEGGSKEGGSNTMVWVVGAIAVLAVGYLSWEYLFKPMLEKKDEDAN